MPSMAKARRTATAPSRVACKCRAMLIWRRAFPAWTSSRRPPSSVDALADSTDITLDTFNREPTMAKPEDTMILETTKGKVVIEMRPDLAPGHVARIKELVKQGFYDGIVFHRVIDGFMAQTGCPQGTGTGGSGKKLKAEFNSEP